MNGLQSSAEKLSFATEKARHLLGQFRRGEANDPKTFVTSIAAVLARYSEAIVTEVTDPRIGLARKTDWLPTVKEVFEACESLATQEALRRKRETIREETLARRAQEPVRSQRPTIEELHEKYGPGWGITVAEVERAERHLHRLARSEAALRASILAEYVRLGRRPVYAGEYLLSPELVDRLRPWEAAHA